ncbi:MULTISPECIES: flavodoxin domain-containing protein [Lactococcus]|jgi:menaquinone-dependent protoporphyrinogen IX oxidase|uniref:flavodoxin domain-containing protein n=1 Tax=Lactococcus TaxID=1357 RepID=UPI00024D9129|nr:MULTISPECIES: flavodoxin domain-containing protein [Lactococcus]MCA2380626.1 flavodoxin [Lactococcus sp. SK2-659]MCI2095973.1 flavodoxin [Lactococcus lactis]MCI2138615.1 flavodoxin [Lactococcus lactis]MCI2189277.1 flavodoxin [Lactococcus lactis]MCT1173245.1 flavodoxin [Lactococcus lactis]
MRTLIAYAGKTGNTAKCARKLAIHLNQVTLVDLNAEVVNPKDFDAVIVASPVYSHKFERSVGSFLKKYQEILQTKPFAAFVTMVEYDSFTKVIKKEIANFGGEVNNLTPFNWHDKIIAKSMIKLESKKHPIEFLPEAEKQFVAQLNKVEWI